jgi:hypothetical protein
MSHNEIPRRGLAKSAYRRTVRVAGAAVLALLVAPGVGAPAWGASSIRVTTLISSEVFAQDAKGAILSVIDTCPVGAGLDRARTRRLIEPSAPGVRLLSRELWPRGMVSRWRLTAAGVFEGATTRQTAVCVEHIAAGASTHTARTSAAVRLWGPASARPWIWANHQTASHWSGLAAVSSARLTKSTATGMRDVMSGLVFGDTVFIMGAPSTRVQPGHFTELRAGMATASRPGRTPTPDNVHVQDFTIPRLGGGDLRWSRYTSGRVLLAAGSLTQTRAALTRLVKIAASTPTHERVVGLVADLFSKDKFRPTPISVIERQAGQLPAPTGYAVAPAPVVWFYDSASNTGQVVDPFNTGVIAIVDNGVVSRYLPATATDADIRESLAATP